MSDAPLHAGDTLEAIFADRRFVVWRWETRQGVKTKVPYVAGAFRKAESDNPATWRTYQEASATLAKGHVDGLGYCLMARDGFAALDLDHCRKSTSGVLEPWAIDLVARAASYTEITPSGEGVRILGIANGVPDAHFHLPRGANGQRIEVFHRATRFITLSEKPLDGTPRPFNDISAILVELQAEKDSKKTSKSAGNGAQPSGSGLGDDTVDLVNQIQSGAVLHPALLALAARMIGAGTFPGAVVNFERVLMEQIPEAQRDERWRSRYADIPRIVETAEEKFSRAHVQSDWSTPLNILGTKLGWGALSRECLPPSLFEYVEAEADRLNVDPCALAVHVLVATSTSIPDAWSIKMKLRDPWTQQARIWGCVIKDVGARGTDMMKAAFWPVNERDRLLRLKHQEEVEKWNVRKAQEDGRKFDAKNDPEPVLERVITTDPTIEAISDILKNGGKFSKLAVVVDELAGLLSGFGHYNSGQGGAERATYLAAYDGGPRWIDRVKRGNIYVPNFSLAVCGNIQTRKISELAPNLINDGLFQRFFGVHAQPSSWREDDDRRVNKMIGARYGELLTQSLPTLLPRMGFEEQPSPAYVATEGQTERKRFAKFLDTLHRNPSLPEVVRETATKWEGLHARLTLLFHVVGLAAQRQDGAELETRELYAVDPRWVVMAAKFLTDVGVPNLLRLGFETFGNVDDNQAHARKLARLILAHRLDTISARDIGRSYRPLRGNEKQAGLVMDCLTAAGWTREADTKRHDRRVWEINPEVHVCFAAEAVAERGRRDEIRQLLKADEGE